MPSDVEAHFRAHRGRVYRWAYALCARHEEALDVVQEVFLRMLRQPPALANAAAAIAWLRRVTARVMIDRWRAEASRSAMRQKLAPREIGELTPETRELTERLHAAIGALSEQQRLVLMAKTYDRMTFAQIAAELNIAVPTAKTHYLRALSAVRGRLKIAVLTGSVP